MNRPAVSRAVTAAAWIAVAALTLLLVFQRYTEAMAGEVGIDLRAWLEATELARRGEDLYDALGYTYTPLLAWLLLPLADREQAMAVWTAVSLTNGALAIAFVVATHRRLLPGWRAPLVAAVAVVTLFYSRVLSIELFLGQNQLLILSLLAFAGLVAARWPAVSGVMIGLVALVKTWPAVIGMWLLRSGNPRRLRSVLAALTTVLAFAIVMALVSGPSSIGRLITRTLELGEQRVPVYSVWYFARQWPPSDATPIPFSEAPLLAQAVTIALVVGVLALILLIVFRPGTPSLALWNIAAVTTLLIPVSHSFYRLLALPLLWVWLAELIGRRPRAQSAIAVVALSLWWFLGFRMTESTVGAGWGQFFAIAATLSVVTLSAGLAAGRQQNPTRSLSSRSDEPVKT